MSVRQKKAASKSALKGPPEELSSKLEAALTENESLRRELAYRDEIIQRLRTSSEGLKTQLETLEQKLTETEHDKKDFVLNLELKLQKLNSDREKEESKMQLQIETLKSENATLSMKLKTTESEFRKTVEEKEAVIDEQGTHISCMATEFESMLNETIENIGKKFQECIAEWTGEMGLTSGSERLLNEIISDKQQMKVSFTFPILGR